MKTFEYHGYTFTSEWNTRTFVLTVDCPDLGVSYKDTMYEPLHRHTMEQVLAGDIVKDYKEIESLLEFRKEMGCIKYS